MRSIVKKILAVVGVTIVIFAAYLAYWWYFQFGIVTQGASIDNYESPTLAIAVVDIQRSMTEKGGKAVVNLAQTDPMITQVNVILKRAKALGLPVVYIRHEFKKGLINMITGGILAEGSEGAKIDPRVVRVNDKVFVKSIMDPFSNPELDAYLRAQKVNRIVVTGMDAEACVDRTIKAALQRGYKVTLAKDAVATGSEEARNTKLAEFKAMGAAVVSSKELLEHVLTIR